MPRRSIIVLTAPSGAGKTTIARHVMDAMPALRFSVSATTRAPRAGEVDGTHYYFLSEEEFREKIADGALIEYEEIYPGRFYGTLRTEVERTAEDAPVLLDIDVKGAMSVKRIFEDDALTVFIRPPSLKVLHERLQLRGTETAESLQQRVERAEMELAVAPQCDAVVVNDDLATAERETLFHIQQFINR